MTQWIRTLNSSGDWGPATWHIAAIPAGLTIARIRFSWGFVLDSPAVTDIQAIYNNLMVLGLVTTVGNGTESVPNPRTSPGDAAPPTQRWLWWETRAPIVTAMSNELGVIMWRDSGPQEETDARGQVLATGIPAGDTLNLWASWAGAFGPDSDVNFRIWAAASVLLKP